MHAQAPRYVRSGFVMAHLVNLILQHLGGTLVLIVPGRQSGEQHTVPLGRPFEVDGIRYLVGGGGETHWVRNLRAEGHGQLRFQGATSPFRAVEIVGPERDRLVAIYRAKQGRTVDVFFKELPEPADHPVFRVEAMA